MAMRIGFQHIIESINDELLLLASMVEQAVFDAMDCLRTGNTTAAKILIENDLSLNQKHVEITERVIAAIATQQPMARDVRRLAAALEVSAELERMGDYAKGIAKLCLRLNGQTHPQYHSKLSQMANIGIEMLHHAMTAYIDQDEHVALAIPRRDDEVDALYQTISEAMMLDIATNPQRFQQINYLMWTAHNLERLADRVINICERTIFVTCGQKLDMDRSNQNPHLLPPF
ncbi:MAG: phosphate signaling complex protein PhoU [Anaerolineales bacterium]